MINLYVNYYQDKHAARQAEIDFSIHKNLSNQLLNVVILNNQDRLKYNDYFTVINAYTASDDINIIANSDIFFDDTIQEVLKIGHKQVYALSRWDWLPDGTSKHFNRKDSQDCWIFRGTIEGVNGDFYLGYRGCDNRIVHELIVAGFKVTNPSLTIKSYHVHNTGLRNYTVTDAKFLVPGPYDFIVPSILN